MKRHSRDYPALGSVCNGVQVKRAKTGSTPGHFQTPNFTQLYDEYGKTTTTITRKSTVGAGGSKPANAVAVDFAPFWRANSNGRFRKSGDQGSRTKLTTTTITTAKPGSVVDIGRQSGYPLLDKFHPTIRTDEPFSTASTAGIIVSTLVHTASFKKYRKDYQMMPKGSIIVCRHVGNNFRAVAANDKTTDRIPLILAEASRIAGVPGKPVAYVARIMGDVAEIQNLTWTSGTQTPKAGDSLIVYVSNDNLMPEAALVGESVSGPSKHPLFYCRLILTPSVQTRNGICTLISPYVCIMKFHKK